ncbi:alpha/beta fold hydrolase [Bacteriovorax sp. Seq25_V]|uniref:alpha/beta fold hydrolase n=1 Tax=Bacteriovorax sp. Seq25_V TaxID=1201288 RepID=UPI00038A3647|nr:alpha/beta hydrolase [Bacteriovorax sp. Seq25_V]EQC45376.1 alpha/beta hydrolase family protein [Bacteriovorax sp. Seq25_V]
MTRNFVLIRGLGRQKGHWSNFPEQLCQAIADAKVHFIDLPGSGSKYEEVFPLETQSLLTQVKNDLDQLKSKHPEGTWHFISISLGGLVTLKLTEHFSKLCDSIIIINSSAKDLSPFYERLNYKIYKTFIAAIKSKDLKNRERIVLDLTTNNISNEEKDRIASEWAVLAEKEPMSMKNFGRQLLWAAKTSAPKKLATRTLIVTGLGDRLVSYNCSVNLARRLGSEIEIHPTAGHDLSLDAPEWLCTHIDKFTN